MMYQGLIQADNTGSDAETIETSTHTATIYAVSYAGSDTEVWITDYSNQVQVSVDFLRVEPPAKKPKPPRFHPPPPKNRPYVMPVRQRKSHRQVGRKKKRF